MANQHSSRQSWVAADMRPVRNSRHIWLHQPMKTEGKARVHSKKNPERGY